MFICMGHRMPLKVDLLGAVFQNLIGEWGGFSGFYCQSKSRYLSATWIYNSS